MSDATIPYRASYSFSASWIMWKFSSKWGCVNSVVFSVKFTSLWFLCDTHKISVCWDITIVLFPLRVAFKFVAIVLFHYSLFNTEWEFTQRNTQCRAVAWNGHWVAAPAAALGLVAMYRGSGAHNPDEWRMSNSCPASLISVLYFQVSDSPFVWLQLVIG